MTKRTSAPAQGASNRNKPSNFTTNVDPVRAFAEAIASDTGATVDALPDGKIHRFDCPEGKRGNRAGWYVLHVDRCPAGAYGSWRIGVSYTWRAGGRHNFNREQRVRIAASIEAAKRQPEREIAAAQTEAARHSQKLWGEAKPATMDHPYLIRKRIPALCLRQRGDCLLVPLCTAEGELVNVQRIFPNGSKRFQRGGRITGAFALFGRAIPAEGQLHICEGWATAATIAITLRTPVVAAMNAGNLKAVAQAIRAARPGLSLTFAADYDHRTPGNPGITKATEAARLVNGAVTWPTTCWQADCHCTDFNDVANCGRALR